ncbi:hypothetical protein LL270_13320 [Pseudomonas aestusnigri]|uniref:hypothetical protein n=1 Tax=Halopseudomonas aestusnigri TaxID=857252 RepID=UPI001D185EA2|nr:hypothetical protein [Halopseudomonas aestusnigri]MCC4261628.1 hypothetical protein [Halopseudomonas aestusnigri]
MLENIYTDPKVFENYFKDLIKLHYKPHNYRDVPDGQRGDFGVECYTLSGHVFQCYLPEQVSDIGKLAEAQRTKINDDTNKLHENAGKLEKLFGNMLISRWILATSKHSSAKLTSYCAQKSLKIREKNLSFISDDFEVLIHTPNEYRIEAAALGQNAYQITVDFDRNSSDDVDGWINTHLTFLNKLDRKLPKAVTEEKISSMRSFLILKYLDYENMMTKLNTEWVDIYEKIKTAVQHREGYLESRFLTAPTLMPSEVIKEELAKLGDDIRKEIPTLRQSDIELIQWGVISDWLIRCPLDF